MPDVVNFQALQRIFRDQVLLLNGKLSTEVVERAGTDANVMGAGACAVGDEVIGQVLDVEAGVFLDSATGQALDRLVFDRYGLVRKPAGAAQVTLSWSTATPSGGAFVIPAGTVVQSSDGTQFQTLASTIYPAGSSGPVTTEARSLLAGVDQQVSTGALTVQVSQVSGAPGNLVVTNPAASFGAADAESDDSLRSRARNFFTTSVRGTLSAIQQGALAYPGVQTATAFEYLDALGRPGGVVQLMITDQFTDELVIYTEAIPSYQTQSDSLATAVYQSLANVRAAGIYVNIQVAVVEMIALTLALTYQANVDPETVAAQAKAAAFNYTNGLPPGTQWQSAACQAAVATTPGLLITGQEVIGPVGVISPTPLQVIRTSMSLVTLAV